MYGHASKPQGLDTPAPDDTLEDQFTGHDLGAEMAAAERPLYHGLRFARSPDPWAEVHEGPAYPTPVDESPALVAGCMLVALPAFFIGAAAGYFLPALGWF